MFEQFIQEVSIVETWEKNIFSYIHTNEIEEVTKTMFFSEAEVCLTVIHWDEYLQHFIIEIVYLFTKFFFMDIIDIPFSSSISELY